MEYLNENDQDEQGSSKKENGGNGERNDEGALSGIPKSEIEGSDADQDWDGEPSIQKRGQDEDEEVRGFTATKRNHWNSITFDYDDFLGGLSPA